MRDQDLPARVTTYSKRPWVANVPKALFEDTRITYNARYFWVAVHMYVSQSNSSPWISLGRLAKIHGRDKKTLRRHRQELIDKGYMKIRYARGANNQLFCYYHLTEEPFQWGDTDSDSPDYGSATGQSAAGGPGHGAPGGRGMVPQGPGSGVPTPRPKTGSKPLETNGHARGPLFVKTPQKDIPNKTTRRAKRGSSNVEPSAPEPPSSTTARNPVKVTDEEGNTPDVKAETVAKEIGTVIKICTGRKPVVPEQTLRMQATEFFQMNCWAPPIHDAYAVADIYYICAKGIVSAQENLPPEKPKHGKAPFDPFFYSRHYADKPGRIFTEDSKGDLILLKIKQEIGYDQPLEFDAIWEFLTKVKERSA